MINYFFTLLLLIFTLSSCDPPEDCNPQVDKESITSQLTAYLKQLE